MNRSEREREGPVREPRDGEESVLESGDADSAKGAPVEPAGESGAPASVLDETVVVVLNHTQDLVNIAGTVRAMLNTGVRRLRLVRPVEYDEYRIRGIAHGAGPILERVEMFETLREAVADALHVVGTTARRRTSAFVWQHPRDAGPELRALAETTGGDRPIALVFGREDVGLLNEELDLCDRLVTVPTDPRHRSLNLAQAALIVLYELWVAGESTALPRPRKTAPPAASADLEALFGSAEEALAALDFFKKRNPPAIMRTLRAIARRSALDAREARLLRAIAIEVRKAVDRLARRTPP